jgi:hypothetical protein
MGLRSPVVGVLYPGNLAPLRPWLPDDVACLDHVNRRRWPDGLRYTHCGREKRWPLSVVPHVPARGVHKPDRTAALWVLLGVGDHDLAVSLFVISAGLLLAGHIPPRRIGGQGGEKATTPLP